MHNYRVNTYIFHQHDIGNYFFFHDIVIHSMSAVFDYYSFAVEFFNVWQRFDQNLRCLHRICHCIFQKSSAPVSSYCFRYLYRLASVVGIDGYIIVG